MHLCQPIFDQLVLRQVTTFLVQQGSLFKLELLETVASEQLQLQEPAYSSPEQNENSTMSIEMGINELVNDADQWDVMVNANAEQPGFFDTLFKSPVFAEDTKRPAVYTLCPAENSQPLNIFMETYPDELAVLNIFMDSSRPENHEVKIQYSKIV
jgi:hypothetical protein